ncbi:MAG TPA: RsmD family RNA methyltransferase, partial [Nakamurella sp.]
MTRIVGGRWRGRRLATPAGGTTRPTSEKVRAALANSLTATGGLVGAAVLDLYAGSGALGLELVSRGAASAVFVERDRAALLALRANVAALGRPPPGSPTPGSPTPGSPTPGLREPGSREPGSRGRVPDELEAPRLTVIPGDV